MQQENQHLTSKLQLISIATTAEITKVREEASRNFLDWLVDEIPDGKKVWPYEIQNKWIEYLHTQLRNPEQEKV